MAKNTSDYINIIGVDVGMSKTAACFPLGDTEEPQFISWPHAKGKKSVDSCLCIGQNGLQVTADYSRKKLDELIRHFKRDMRDAEVRLYPRKEPRYSPLHAVVAILREVRQLAEEQIRKELRVVRGSLKSVVLSVPVDFGIKERRYMKEAAQQAGFQETHLIDEAVASALSLRLHERDGCSLVMVVDVGGLTTDATLLFVGRGVRGGIVELGRCGHDLTGGTVCDESIVDMIISKLRSKGQSEPEKDTLEWFQLEQMAKEVKHLFSSGHTGDVPVSCSGSFIRLSRADFECALKFFPKRIETICQKLIDDVSSGDIRSALGWGYFFGKKRCRHGVTWEHIDDIYLVGGAARTLGVIETIEKRWGRRPTIPPEPELTVAKGAATYAGMLWSGKRLPGLPQRVSRSIGYFRFTPEGQCKPRIVLKRGQRLDRPIHKQLLIPLVARNGGAVRSSEKFVMEFFEEHWFETKTKKIGDVVISDLPPPNQLPKEPSKCRLELDLIVESPEKLRVEARLLGRKKEAGFNLT